MTLQLSEYAIEVKWEAPVITEATVPAIQEFHVYRGELEAAAADAGKTPQRADWKSPLLLLATTREPGYQDTGFDYGKTYAYMVRSVILAEGKPLESSDSPLAILKAVDTFPPKAPEGLVAAVLPGGAPGSVVVDLSWSINLEHDVAGYRVYRSGQEGARGESITRELLLTPAYRDTSAQAGKHYWYSVTAVDRAGQRERAEPADRHRNSESRMRACTE